MTVMVRIMTAMVMIMAMVRIITTMVMMTAMVRMMGNTHLGLKDETETAPGG